MYKKKRFKKYKRSHPNKYKKEINRYKEHVKKNGNKFRLYQCSSVWFKHIHDKVNKKAKYLNDVYNNIDKILSHHIIKKYEATSKYESIALDVKKLACNQSNFKFNINITREALLKDYKKMINTNKETQRVLEETTKREMIERNKIHEYEMLYRSIIYLTGNEFYHKSKYNYDKHYPLLNNYLFTEECILKLILSYVNPFHIRTLLLVSKGFASYIFKIDSKISGILIYDKIDDQY